MSSFIRKTKVSASKTDHASPSSSSAPTLTSGCKPWIQTGLGLVSSGHRELDDILGGGCPLGTITLVLKDRLSNYAETILTYALSESISHDRSVLLLATSQWDVNTFISSAPLNLNYERTNQGTAATAASQLEKEKIRKDDDRGDVKLTIAWQYEKYLVKDSSSKVLERTADGRLPFCCSYDLSRQLQPQLIKGKLSVFTWSEANITSPFELLGSLLQQAAAFLQAKPEAAAISRIFLLSFHEIIMQIATSLPLFECCQLVTRFFVALKRLIRVHRCAVTISITPTIIPSELLAHNINCMDTVVEIESFAGNMDHIPYEFQEFVGFFIVRKMQRVGMLAPFPAKAARYGLKRDRRKLYIEPLHLPPEESRALASQTTKIVEAETAVNQQQQQAHSHTHTHQFHHASYSDEPGKSSNKDPLLRQPVQLQVEPSILEVEKPASSKPNSIDESNISPKKPGLAASLAAARAARAAGAKLSTAEVQPVSISGASAAKNEPSLDF